MNTIEAAAREFLKQGKFSVLADLNKHEVTVAPLLAAFHLSMCSKEGPSDEPVAWMNEDGKTVTAETMKLWRAAVERKEWTAEVAVNRYPTPLYRHPAPKVGALLEAGDAMDKYIDAGVFAMPYDGPAPMALSRNWRRAKADASLQGEGSSLDLGDAVQSDGPGDPAVGCPPPHDLTHGQATSPPPPIAEHPQGQPSQDAER